MIFTHTDNWPIFVTIAEIRSTPLRPSCIKDYMNVSFVGLAVVVYVRDAESRHLAADKLYNYNLSSVRAHQELSKLNAEQCVLSVFDNFTPFQTQHLMEITGDAMRR
jgi:hypothetical protein